MPALSPRPLFLAIPLLAPLLVGACGGQEMPVAAQNATIPAVRVPARDRVIDHADEPAILRVALRELPPEFRGRWALGSADCDTSKADIAKGLMVVEPRQLVFYESRGAVGAITVAGDDHLTLDVAFTGEGQAWNHRVDLTLSDGRATLTRFEPESDAPNLTYRRCPA